MKYGLITKRLVTIGLVVGLAATSLCGCTTPTGKPIYFESPCDDNTLFIIGKQSCSLSMAKTFILNARAVHANVAGVDLYNEGFDTETISASLKSSVLEHLTKVFVLCNYGKEQELSLSEADQKKIKEAAHQYYSTLSSEEKKYIGCGENEIANMYELYAMAMKVNNYLMDTVDSEVSEDEARIMEAQVILVDKMDDAIAVNQKIEAGQDFEKLARNYTRLDTVNFTFSRGTFGEGVDDIVFNLNNGEISPEILTAEGYYFFKCINKYNAELSEENKTTIVEKRKQKMIEDITKEMEEKNFSDFNTKQWEALSLEDVKDFSSDGFFEILNAADLKFN